MDIQRRFPSVHWIWEGAISFVYEVHPRIVVKVPKSGDFEREQFRKELKIYEIFSRHPPCLSVVQCFFYADNGIFLEYMRDVSLSSRIQNNHIRDEQTMMVTKPVAFLESLNLAHGDLRPENILLDRNRLKLSDFDYTAEIGTDFEACMAPYGRILNSNETDQGRGGTSGFLGSRTEQFALGSLYYLINYGFEVYGDRCLTENPKEHGPKVVDLLQNLEFPKLDGDPAIDDIIYKCWHNKYATVADLVAQTETLVTESTNEGGANTAPISITQWRRIIGRLIRGLWCSLRDWWMPVREGTNGETTNTELANGRKPNDGICNDMDQDHPEEDFLSKKAFCQDLEKRGLLHLLSSGEPEQLGCTFEWYRLSS